MDYPLSYERTKELMTRISVGRYGIEATELPEATRDDRCIICYCALASPDHKLVTHCGCETKEHWLHYRCLMTWLHKSPTCPVCRVEVKLEVSNSACFICNAACIERDDSPYVKMKCCHTVLHWVCYFSTDKEGVQCFRCGKHFKFQENYEPCLLDPLLEQLDVD